MKTLNWSKIPVNAPMTRREQAELRAECPRVIADIIEARNVTAPNGTKHPGGVELRIAAIFRWPNRDPNVVILRREVVLETMGAFSRAKVLVAAYWDEHIEGGEIEVLETMWRLPNMSAGELEVYKAGVKKRRKEAEERARKKVLLDESTGHRRTVDLIDERTHAAALTGKKVN